MTRKEKDKQKAMFGEKGEASDVVATLEFEPPTHVRWSRFDSSGKTSFITAFYCSPAGPSSVCLTALTALENQMNHNCSFCMQVAAVMSDVRLLRLSIYDLASCAVMHVEFQRLSVMVLMQMSEGP